MPLLRGPRRMTSCDLYDRVCDPNQPSWFQSFRAETLGYPRKPSLRTNPRPHDPCLPRQVRFVVDFDSARDKEVAANAVYHTIPRDGERPKVMSKWAITKAILMSCFCMA